LRDGAEDVIASWDVIASFLGAAATFDPLKTSPARGAIVALRLSGFGGRNRCNANRPGPLLRSVALIRRKIRARFLT
jgi:hypothetical protein